MTRRAAVRVVDSAATLDQEIDAIRAILEQSQVDNYSLGLHFNRIIDNKLAEAAGYKSALQAIERFFPDLSQAELYRYSRVARHFPVEMAKKYGVTRLDLLVSYATLAHLALDADPINTPVKVPQDGQEISKVFGDCSANELRGAIRYLKHPTEETIPPDDLDQLRVLHEALVGATGADSHVSLRGYVQAGVTTVNVEHIPLALFGKVAAALAQAASEGPSVKRAAAGKKAKATVKKPTSGKPARASKPKGRR